MDFEHLQPFWASANAARSLGTILCGATVVVEFDVTNEQPMFDSQVPSAGIAISILKKQ